MAKNLVTENRELTSVEKQDVIEYANMIVRIAHNVFQSKLANLKSKISHNGILKGETGFILGDGQLFPFPKQSSILDHKISKRFNSIPPINFFPLAPISKPVQFYSGRHHDFVGKRTPWIKTAATDSTAVVPYDPEFAAKQGADFAFVGPRRDGATGFEWHATQQRLRDEENERNRHARAFESSTSTHRWSGRRNYIYDTMSDYDREMHDLKKRYGGSSEKARDVWERNLFKEFKWLKPIAKANPLIAKNLPKISSVLKSASEIPILGRLIKNPALALAGGILKMGVDQAHAARSILSAEMAGQYGGGFSLLSMGAMYGAGMGYGNMFKTVAGKKAFLSRLKYDPGAWDILVNASIASMGKFDMSGIRPDMSYEDYMKYVFNQASRITNDGDRINTLAALGFSDEDYRIGMNLANPNRRKSKAERITSRAQKWKDSRDYLSKNGSLWQRVNALFTPDWWIDFWSSDYENGLDQSEKLIPRVFRNVSAANEAADSLDAHQNQGRDYTISTGDTTNNNGRNTSVAIYGNVNVTTDNPEGFTDQLVEKSGVNAREAQAYHVDKGISR